MRDTKHRQGISSATWTLHPSTLPLSQPCARLQAHEEAGAGGAEARVERSAATLKRLGVLARCWLAGQVKNTLTREHF